MVEIKVCPISGKNMKPVFTEKVLGKYDVTYFYCEESGLLQTEKAYWLKEAYQTPIADIDTGLLSRNLLNIKRLEPILQVLFNGKGKFIDVGGGYGILTRLMRDIGFDCYTIDKYSENLFAKAFEPADGVQADALFAFEVLEHLQNPKEFLNEIFSRYSCKTLVFSTLIFRGKFPKTDWWYYAFESGQHVTFYQARTLKLLAKKFGCRYIMIHPELHIMTNVPISTKAKILFLNRRLFKLYSIYTRHKRRNQSLTWKDHLLMKSKCIQRSDKIL